MHRKRRLVVGILLRPLLYCVYFTSGFFRRNTRVWVFGTWGGERLSDNSAALFRYCCALEDRTIRPVWISPSGDLRAQVRSEGLEAYHPWSIRGVGLCLRAGIYIFDVRLKDINYWLSRRAKRVLLRHGTGIKKTARATDNPSRRMYKLFHGRWWERATLRFLLPWHTARLDLVMATSEQHAQQGVQFYDVDEGRVAVTGSPRNDVLFSEPEGLEGNPVSTWIDEGHRLGKLVFIYMPTFRDDRRPAFPYSWKDLDELAGRSGVRILAKLHPVDAARPTRQQTDRLENIRFGDPAGDPYQLFGKIDCLITDYSSVVYDFMMLRKPVVFFCPDLDDFLSDSRGFCYDYEEVTPAPKVRTLEELEGQIGNIVNRSPELSRWEGRYEEILKRFHLYQDGRSSERCYEAIVGRLV